MTPKIEPESTRLDWDMTAAEEILFEQARNIARHWDRKRDLAPHERLISEQACKILTRRYFDVFFTYVRYVVCHNDPVAQYMFYGWFKWFMEDAQYGIWQFLRESEIYDQEGKSWKQKEKEADAFYKKHWKSKLFSRESFDKAMKEWSNDTGMAMTKSE